MTQKNTLRFAIPTFNGELCAHFGHCEVFTLIDVDENNKIINTETKTPPPHEPGILPPWLTEQGVDIIIAAGIGARAISLFKKNNIKVIVGVEEKNPENLVQTYLDGSLKTKDNMCNH